MNPTDIGSGQVQAAIILFSGWLVGLCALAGLHGWWWKGNRRRTEKWYSEAVKNPLVLSTLYSSPQMTMQRELLQQEKLKGDSTVTVDSILKFVGISNAKLNIMHTAEIEVKERLLRQAADELAVLIRHRMYPPEAYSDDNIEGAFKRV